MRAFFERLFQKRRLRLKRADARRRFGDLCENYRSLNAAWASKAEPQVTKEEALKAFSRVVHFFQMYYGEIFQDELNKIAHKHGIFNLKSPVVRRRAMEIFRSQRSPRSAS